MESSEEAGGSVRPPEKTAHEELGERILREAPRLGRYDEFKFACHPGVSCFGACCADINIALTPYDVLRLKNHLGITSDEFLKKYTIVPFTKNQRLPVPILKMRDDERKTCQFNDDGSCQVYEDRPWACRMYPVGFAAPPEGSGEMPFYFLLEEEGCKGFQENQIQSIDDWVGDQGIQKYDEMGGLFQPLNFDERLADGRELDPKQMQMYWMATYDLDAFRRFVFGSTFLERFEVADEEVEAIREDDEALMRFAFRWLEFALSGKRTMKLRETADPEQHE